MISKLSNLLQLFRDMLPARNMEELEQRLARAQEKEDMPLLINRISEQIDLQAEYLLNDLQTRLWGLLTMARLVMVGKRLSVLPGCDVLGDLGQAADLILRSFQAPITQDEYQFLLDTCDGLYELGDAECFSDMTRQVEIPGGAPLQAFDLNGLLIPTELNMYLDSHLRLLTGGADESEAETGLIPCGLLPDYYLRTCREDLSLLPQINQEIERIESDYDFVRAKITWQDITERVAQYKELDILACG